LDLKSRERGISFFITKMLTQMLGFWHNDGFRGLSPWGLSYGYGLDIENNEEHAVLILFSTFVPWDMLIPEQKKTATMLLGNELQVRKFSFRIMVKAFRFPKVAQAEDVLRAISEEQEKYERKRSESNTK
jgi:hypothetical protein